MDAPPKIISNKKLHLILFMRNNSDIISFKTQNIYKNNASFKRALKDLHDRKVILIRQLRTGNEYKLTDFGKQIGMILNELTE